MTSALVTPPALLAARLCHARTRLLLLTPKQLIQRVIESICSVSAFVSSSSSSFSSVALVTLGLRSWHKCRGALCSLSTYISVKITVAVNISSTILESTLKPVLAASQRSQRNVDFTESHRKVQFHSTPCSRVIYLLGTCFQPASSSVVLIQEHSKCR